MPYDDPQFWCVTAAAAAGLWVLVRQLLPSRDEGAPACGGCASGAAACARPREPSAAREVPESPLRVVRE